MPEDVYPVAGDCRKGCGLTLRKTTSTAASSAACAAQSGKPLSLD